MIGIPTYPDRWKSRYACPYYALCTPSLPLQNIVGPLMGLHICIVISLRVGTNRSLPFNSFRYAELEVIALYSHEHKGNYTPTECIGSRFDKFSTPLIMFVHFYRTGLTRV